MMKDLRLKIYKVSWKVLGCLPIGIAIWLFIRDLLEVNKSPWNELVIVLSSIALLCNLYIVYYLICLYRKKEPPFGRAPETPFVVTCRMTGILAISIGELLELLFPTKNAFIEFPKTLFGNGFIVMAAATLLGMAVEKLASEIRERRNKSKELEENSEENAVENSENEEEKTEDKTS